MDDLRRLAEDQVRLFGPNETEHVLAAGYLALLSERGDLIAAQNYLREQLHGYADRLAAAESQREALRAAFLPYLATDGHHGMWDAMVFSDANAEVVRLIGGEDVIRDEGDRLMRPYRAALKEQPR